MMEDSAAGVGGDAPYDPAAAATASMAMSAGRGRGRGRGRGGGGVAIAGIAELDATMGRGAPLQGTGRGGGLPVPGAGGGKAFVGKKIEKDFRGPEGLFKKGDWTCTLCGNVNWERRQTCNKCQNQKPNVVTGDESREGLGGGFNERQDRASVGTVEVDEDGYDDFGRKKNKARVDKKAKEMAALARLRKSYGGGLLGASTLAPTLQPPVPGQFEDAGSARTPGMEITTYDEFGRPKRAGIGMEGVNGLGKADGKRGNFDGHGKGNGAESEEEREKGGGGDDHDSGDRDRGRDRERDRDRREKDKDRERGRGSEKDRGRRRGRSRERSRDRSRERSRDRSKDRSRERGRDEKEKDRSRRRRSSRSRSRERRR